MNVPLLRRLAPIAVACSSACALPVDDPPSRQDPVTFTGYTTTPGRAISATCSNEPYPAFGPAFTPTPLTTFFSTNETLSQAGQTVYYYEVELTIPEECWHQSASPPWRAAVQFTDVATGRVHEHFEENSGYPCLVESYFGGAGPVDAFLECAVGLNASQWTTVRTAL